MPRPLQRLSGAFRARPLLVVPLFLCLYGYGTIDVADFYALSANPLGLNPEATKQFLHSSALPYFLGNPFTALLGARAAFAIVMLGGVALALGALRWLTRARYGAHANDAMLMVFATPLLIVLTQYLGKSDAYLVAAFFATVAATNPILQAAAALLVVLSHREIGLLILAGAILVRVLRPGPWMIGAALGVVLVFAYHHVLLPSPPQSRADLGASYLRDAFAITLGTPVLHLVWTFGPFWWCVTRAWPLNWREGVVFLVALGLAAATLDFTRVFTLVSVPLVIAIVDRIVEAFDRRDAPAWLDALPLLALIQAHLLSSFVFDSRIPELLGRVTGWLVIQR